ncbi:DUF190 domain-containing protein [Streptomyces sp. NA02950]|uniref:DUF190 domain-containing protein n=1 Tax=Streptomyces sp. NA02950 TaxID=2742137 RepID=UPI00159034A9|nr:DUF190 domain-containing protein [Streptomyces sp. NA02950]QKV94902.1 DUF190 domain-containing protein [Streptomyces sp. NA02950]
MNTPSGPPPGAAGAGAGSGAGNASAPGTNGLRLTVFVGERDTWHHRPLFAEIVHRAHRAGLAGASVFRGVEGYGSSSMVHTSRLLSLGEDLPMAVVIIDTEERVRSFLPGLEDIVGDALMVVDPVEIVGRPGRAR